MNLWIAGGAFLAGGLYTLATFLSGSMWRGKISSALETETSQLISGIAPAPGK